MRELLERLFQRQDLSREQAAELFGQMVRGACSDIEIAAAVAALKTKGECADEITGAAQALRAAAVPFPRPDYPTADTCGTGGDGAHTVNISTAAAFVAAECGIPIVKHGNRSVSSKCGSADVLEMCGVKLDPTPEVARRCLDEAGICFLMAPQYHAGIRHVMPVRRALKTRTIFNLLGPLLNPALPPWQIMGIYDPAHVETAARTLGMLGARAALVVHGSGLDEIAIHGPTTAALWKDGQLTHLTLTPEDAGLTRYPLEALAGGTPEENTRWLKQLLAGNAKPAHLAAVSLNVGALLWITDTAPSLLEGTRTAFDTIVHGRPVQRLKKLIEVSNA